MPVCEGINLQYFFSYIDSPGWGCGTGGGGSVSRDSGVSGTAGGRTERAWAASSCRHSTMSCHVVSSIAVTASSGSASWRSVLVRVAVEPATLKSHPSGSCWVVITQGVEGNNSAPAPSSRITTSGVTPRSVHWRLNASASGAVMKRSLPTVLTDSEKVRCDATPESKRVAF